jgi:cold shock CspA family protein
VKFNGDRGFGFIRQAERLADLFFHASEFSGDEGLLRVGAKVEFDLGEHKGKIVARDVRLLEAGGGV